MDKLKLVRLLLVHGPKIRELAGELKDADTWADRFVVLEHAVRYVAPLTEWKGDDLLVAKLFDTKLRGIAIAVLERLDPQTKDARIVSSHLAAEAAKAGENLGSADDVVRLGTALTTVLEIAAELAQGA